MSDAWLQFRSIFQDALDNCVPTYKPKEKKSLYSNSEVFSLKRKKNHLWKKYLSTRSLIDLANFKSVNNQLRSLTRNLRKDYEKNLAQGVRSRPKAFWQYVNSRTKVRPSVTELVSSDGSAIHSDTEMATPSTLTNIFLVYLPARTPQVFQQLIQLVPLSLMTTLKSLLQ